jgi:hypothetical protein
MQSDMLMLSKLDLLAGDGATDHAANSMREKSEVDAYMHSSAFHN